jgi:hypothetical protein
MNFSHEQTENSVGAAFLKQFQDLSSAAKDDKTAQDYLNNLNGIIGAYLRTSAYERDAFVRFLNVLDEMRDARVKNITAISDVASVSSGSFLSKVGTFLGVGTLAQLAALATNAGSTPGLPINLLYVLAGGLAGVVLLVFGIRLFNGRLIANAETQNFQRKQAVWSNMARPLFRGELMRLLQRLKTNVHVFYPGYSEEILQMDEKALESYLDQLLPDKGLYAFKTTVSSGRLSVVSDASLSSSAENRT